MISDNFWKILFLLMVFTGLWFWFKNHSEKNVFKRSASELADLIAFSEDTLPRNDAEAEQRFIRDLVERTVTQLEGHAERADLTALATHLDQHPATSSSVAAGTEVRMSRRLFLAIRSD